MFSRVSRKWPKKILKSIVIWDTLFFYAFLFQCGVSFYSLFSIGADTDQGEVYRILFLHVPVALCAFFWIFCGSLFGVFELLGVKKREVSEFSWDQKSHVCMELSALFSFFVLLTGSFWAKPTWGVWWDWDPRLTSSLVLFFLCCAYLVMRSFTEDRHTRKKISAILSILCVINVPIVYFSVNLWRSLHQPQTFVQKTQNASSDIGFLLLCNVLSCFLLSLCLYQLRRQSVVAQENLDAFRGETL